MNTATANPRRQAARLLQDILLDRGSLAQLSRPRHDDNDALVQELCYGACRHYQELEAVASRFLKKPLRRKDLDVHCHILLGLYQLFYMRVPDHAAINETVSAVGKKPWARGLANAVLRNARRAYPEYDASLHDAPHLRYSHPAWLCEALAHDWPAQQEAILAANNRRAPMTLRVNLRHGTRDAYLARLRDAGVEASACVLSDVGVQLASPSPVQALPGFDEGLVSVQDEASQLVPALLAPTTGNLRVLDACAAPGGKTCGLLERFPDIELVSVDSDEQRLTRVHDNLARLGLSATVACQDAAALPGDLGDFDRILIDAPCSAVGVIRRHPDIKILRTPAQVKQLQQRQQALLRALWPRLRRGGRLLYSTCSTLLRENNQQIAEFIDNTPDARHHPIEADWGHALDYGRQLLPGEYNQDGFYYALLEKC